jgi:hypothetical protein
MCVFSSGPVRSHIVRNVNNIPVLQIHDIFGVDQNPDPRIYASD